MATKLGGWSKIKGGGTAPSGLGLKPPLKCCLLVNVGICCTANCTTDSRSGNFGSCEGKRVGGWFTWLTTTRRDCRWVASLQRRLLPSAKRAAVSADVTASRPTLRMRTTTDRLPTTHAWRRRQGQWRDCSSRAVVAAARTVQRCSSQWYWTEEHRRWTLAADRCACQHQQQQRRQPGRLRCWTYWSDCSHRVGLSRCPHFPGLTASGFHHRLRSTLPTTCAFPSDDDCRTTREPPDTRRTTQLIN